MYCNDEFFGDETALSKYVSTRYILPMKNFYQMGRQELKKYLAEIMSHGVRVHWMFVEVFFDSFVSEEMYLSDGGY